jgi:hypothetical protein
MAPSCFVYTLELKVIIRFEVYTAVTMKNDAVFCDVMPCGCCKKRSFGGTYRLHHQGDIVYLHSVLRLLVAANAVVTLMMVAIHSSETRFLQQPHGVTYQRTALFKAHNNFRIQFLILDVSNITA